jgi:hypothetical protein
MRNRDFGEAEIEDFGMVTLGDEEIGWLDITMNDAVRVGCIKSVGDLYADIEELLGFERVTIELPLPSIPSR